MVDLRAVADASFVDPEAWILGIPKFHDQTILNAIGRRGLQPKDTATDLINTTTSTRCQTYQTIKRCWSARLASLPDIFGGVFVLLVCIIVP